MSEHVHCERRGGAGIIHLDRSRALNALDHAMIRAIGRQLALWRDDPAIACVIIKGLPGRAFSAGGDVRAAIATRDRDGIPAAARFFYDEYRTNWRIANFPKPYIALLDGITMGGGCGLSVHGTYRVVTENATLAMPEATIGFFPDVGAGYFLPRCPPGIGNFMALTGARLNAADSLFAGLATHHVASSHLDALEKRLARVAPGPEAAQEVRAALAAAHAPLGGGPVAERAALIGELFTADDLAGVLHGLTQDAGQWGAACLETIRQRSPLSCRLAWALLERGRDLGLEGDLRLEYRLAYRSLLEGADFAEGVRALLIDKDKSPRWQHEAIEDLDEATINAWFAPLNAPIDELSFDWDID